MAKNKKNDNKKYFTLENAIDTALTVNTVALTTTEKIFDKGFEVAEKLQSLTEEYLKKGLKFSAKQQDVVFDTLEDTKEKALKTYTKVSKRFTKKAA